MLQFLKRLFGAAPKVAVEEVAPYKVETPVVDTTPAPAQADKKAATGAAKSTAKKGAEAGVKPARRRKKPAAT
jgi:hypothetical protein